jgi:hypothetical protein
MRTGKRTLIPSSFKLAFYDSSSSSCLLLFIWCGAAAAVGFIAVCIYNCRDPVEIASNFHVDARILGRIGNVLKRKEREREREK